MSQWSSTQWSDRGLVPLRTHARRTALLTGVAVVLAVITARVADDAKAGWALAGFPLGCGVGAALASYLKKSSWLRTGVDRHAEVLAGTRPVPPGQQFWRVVCHEQRVHVIVSGVGAGAVWLGLVVVVSAFFRAWGPRVDLSQATVGVIIMVVGGGVVAVGLWAAAQTWRSGEGPKRLLAQD